MHTGELFVLHLLKCPTVVQMWFAPRLRINDIELIMLSDSFIFRHLGGITTIGVMKWSFASVNK